MLRDPFLLQDNHRIKSHRKVEPTSIRAFPHQLSSLLSGVSVVLTPHATCTYHVTRTRFGYNVTVTPEKLLKQEVLI